ncbi:hypothetical protein EV644_115171 [Kribbella orskensis]|uniref:Uncharacterized protein n=1 Tax=Kribbella orskensis TaxID=2512216 RepID=A0ABY2BDM5_9ACTN|nr:hypothetical protein EV642_116171 [Kribbella sp. VKM Ac-2500]TCO17149.1 hypothetical protein EV644_115171 [Kribbella orskensis]
MPTDGHSIATAPPETKWLRKVGSVADKPQRVTTMACPESRMGGDFDDQTRLDLDRGVLLPLPQ